MNPLPIVLIIDDELIIHHTLDALLNREPYVVRFAASGLKGLAIAVDIHPDVILLDVMMPDMDGFEVCRRIRATPSLAEIPIIMITSLDDRDSRIQGLEAGADDFLNKPFDSLELLARLHTITRLNRYRHLVDQRNQLQKLNDELLNAYDKTIEGWTQALDLRDKETEGHTLRVTQKTINFARIAGVSDEQLVHIKRGALLHDIGKLAIPDTILFKAGRLDEAEWQIMHQHPDYAYKWLSTIEYLHPALDIPYCHHEKWDGSGYPRGLKGEEIPLAARLFSIVDVWDALRSERPYHSGMPDSEVIEYLKAQIGKYFDPSLTEIFIKWIASEEGETPPHAP